MWRFPSSPFSSTMALFSPTLNVQTARTQAPAPANVRMETVADLKVLAEKLNPKVGYFNPLGLGDTNTDATTGLTIDWWGEGEEAAIGWLRHAEIKHGRVAMAAFVGYCVQSNGIVFPWALTGFKVGNLPGFGSETVMFSDIAAAGAPAAQWDALPTASKLQILSAIFFLEVCGESSYGFEQMGTTHYMRGGKPGLYPDLKKLGLPHPVPLNLWDPLGFTAKMSEERKAKALLAEINNGRLAMIGIFGLISASKGLIVPGLDSLGIAKYDGQYMAPFSASDSSLAGVTVMLDKFPDFPWQSLSSDPWGFHF